MDFSSASPPPGEATSSSRSASLSHQPAPSGTAALFSSRARGRSLAGVTQVALLIVVYDALAHEIGTAGLAAGDAAIGLRCQASERALLLLGHLQTWSIRLAEPALVEGLNAFYETVRNRLVQLQAAGTARDFAELAESVLEVRRSWQVKERELLAAAPYLQPAPAVTLD